MGNEILKRILENQEAMAKSQEAIFGEIKELKQGQAETNQRLEKLETDVADISADSVDLKSNYTCGARYRVSLWGAFGDWIGSMDS